MRNEYIHIRVTKEEKEYIEKMAKESHNTLTNFVVIASLEKARKVEVGKYEINKK